jgi:Tol biopolymer transport system component
VVRVPRAYLRACVAIVCALLVTTSASIVAIRMPQPQLSPSPSAKQLTFGSFDDVDVAFDPSGRFIVFASDRNGKFDIWVMNIDGRHLRQLTRLAGDERRPVWSSDGRKIAFVTDDISNASLWIVGIDGGEPRRLASHNQIGVVEWQRKGSMIAYEALDKGQWGVWIISENGVSKMQLPCSVHDCRYPSWSADSLAVFYVARTENSSEIRLNSLGKADRTVRTIAGDIRCLSVSPTGNYLAFVYDEGAEWGLRGKGEWGLWAIPTSEEGIVPIMTNRLFNASSIVKPMWSADGKNLMSIGQFNYGNRRPDLAVVLFRPNIVSRPFGGMSTKPVFTAVADDKGTVSSFSSSPIGDNLVYTLSVDQNTHLWTVLRAKPTSPYGS